MIKDTRMDDSRKFIVNLRQFLQRQPEAGPGNVLLACISGGADSTALLCGLTELAPEMGFFLKVVHVNHGIRGKEADKDEAFVRKMCQKANVPFYCKHLAFPAGAKISEARLREERFRVIVEIARKLGASAALLAHHQDDLAETLLLRLLRGSGLTGLSGFAERSKFQNLTILRPLRDVSRETILAFLRSKKIPWREDHSNVDISYLRNRVRHKLLPILERDFNPDIKKTLARTASILSQMDEFVRTEAESLFARGVQRLQIPNEQPVEWARLDTFQPLPDLILAEIFRLWIMQLIRSELPPAFGGIDALIRLVRSGESGSLLRLTRGIVAFRDYEMIVMSRTTLPRGAKKSQLLAGLTPALLKLQNRSLKLPIFTNAEMRLEIRKKDLPPMGKKKTITTGNTSFTLRIARRNIKPAAAKMVIPLSVMRFPVILRTRQRGDRIAFGGISKPLKKWYNEARAPIPLRNHLVVGEDVYGVFYAGGEIFRTVPQKLHPHYYLIVEWKPLTSDRGQGKAKGEKSPQYRFPLS